MVSRVWPMGMGQKFRPVVPKYAKAWLHHHPTSIPCSDPPSFTLGGPSSWEDATFGQLLPGLAHELILLQLCPGMSTWFHVSPCFILFLIFGDVSIHYERDQRDQTLSHHRSKTRCQPWDVRLWLQKNRLSSQAKKIRREGHKHDKHKHTYNWVYIYIYVYIYICIYIYIYICIYVCTYIFLYVYMYMCIDVYMYRCMCIYICQSSSKGSFQFNGQSFARSFFRFSRLAEWLCPQERCRGWRVDRVCEGPEGWAPFPIPHWNNVVKQFHKPSRSHHHFYRWYKPLKYERFMITT